MNDRFKFRVWSIANQRYCHFATMDISADGLLRVIRPLEQSEYIDDYENRYIIQQCTGLKDKNGTLIYEGDILKQPDGIIDYVYWSDGCYIHNGTAITNYDVAYQGDSWAKEVNTHEVIGNIYENKELLQ